MSKKKKKEKRTFNKKIDSLKSPNILSELYSIYFQREKFCLALLVIKKKEPYIHILFYYFYFFHIIFLFFYLFKLLFFCSRIN